MPNNAIYLGNSVTELQNNGYTIIPWTINRTDIMLQLIEETVDGIITDYPDSLLLLMNKMNIHLKNNSPKNYKTLNFLREWSLRRNVGAVNGGTGSYSPSLMSVQLEVLENDFNIKPNFVIAYIDQTDLGDENCRYKDNKIFKDKKLISVGNSKSLEKEIFNYNKILKFSEINLTSNSKIYKVFRYNVFQLRQPQSNH